MLKHLRMHSKGHLSPFVVAGGSLYPQKVIENTLGKLMQGKAAVPH